VLRYSGMRSSVRPLAAYASEGPSARSDSPRLASRIAQLSARSAAAPARLSFAPIAAEGRRGGDAGEAAAAAGRWQGISERPCSQRRTNPCSSRATPKPAPGFRPHAGDASVAALMPAVPPSSSPTENAGSRSGRMSPPASTERELSTTALSTPTLLIPRR